MNTSFEAGPTILLKQQQQTLPGAAQLLGRMEQAGTDTGYAQILQPSNPVSTHDHEAHHSFWGHHRGQELLPSPEWEVR